MRTKSTNLKCLYWELKVIQRTCRRGEVEHIVNLANNTDSFTHITPDQMKRTVPLKTRYVLFIAREEIVNSDNTPVLL